MHDGTGGQVGEAASLNKTAHLTGVTLDFRPSGTLNIPDLLDRSELQLAIGPPGTHGERFSVKRLLQDQFVVVHRKGHPAAKQRELSTEKLTSLPRLEISSAQFGTDFFEIGPQRPKSGPGPVGGTDPGEL